MPDKIPVIRLYDKDGVQVFAIVPCCLDEDKWDLCRPEGKVEFCGVDPDLVESLQKFFPPEWIN